MKGDDRIAGVDLSFAGTGVVVLNEDGEMVDKKCIVTSPKDGDVIDRCCDIRLRLMGFLQVYKPYLDSVIIEGPSFNSKGRSGVDIGMLHGVIRAFLRHTGIPCHVVPPATLKKFVTGRGNAPKEVMMLKIFKRWGVEFENNNLADAYALARWGLELAPEAH